MATVIHEKRVVRGTDGDVIDDDSAMLTIANVVYTLFGILIALLSLRVILSLLGADRSNMFADFIYTVTQPFVAPFVGLFNIDETFGVSRLEFETLFAILIYALLAWVIVRLLTAGTNRVIE